jgi:hypothetical protein
MITTINGQIACKPFVLEKVTKGVVKDGVLLTPRSDSLLKTEVVFWSERDSDKDAGSGKPISIGPSDIIYVRPDILNSPASKQVYEFAGQTFILIPLTSVVLVEEV